MDQEKGEILIRCDASPHDSQPCAKDNAKSKNICRKGQECDDCTGRYFALASTSFMVKNGISQPDDKKGYFKQCGDEKSYPWNAQATDAKKPQRKGGGENNGLSRNLTRRTPLRKRFATEAGDDGDNE